MDRVVVVGPPGSGKTTTAAGAADLVWPRADVVVWLDLGLGDRPESRAPHPPR